MSTSAARLDLLASRKRVVVADLFCGAGSLSAGIVDALVELGFAPQFVAVNHWDIATQTYARNHPEAAVHCMSLETASPTQCVPGGFLDLLAAGIDCTYFSRARGGKPITDQQRVSAWHVVRWCTELTVKRLLLENVPEFADWGPVSPRTGKPIKSRKGEYFAAFIDTLRGIGFRPEWRVVNCADHGDPTTRQRLFILAAEGGKPVSWPAPSHTRDGVGDARWRSAASIIDWSIRGTSIYDRKRPLVAATLARIGAGMVKENWPEPFIVVLRQHCASRGIHLPLPTIAAAGQHLALVEPIEPGAFVLSNQGGGAARSVERPVPGIVNRGGHALIAPYYGSGSGETCRSAVLPLPAATTKARFGLVVPITHRDGSNRARSTKQPLPTLTTAKRGELALVTGAPKHDALFRMFQPHELAAAMSISSPESPYFFTGNKTQVVRQIGQAVPRRTARALARALMGVS